jgi:hypothetical protein
VRLAVVAGIGTATPVVGIGSRSLAKVMRRLGPAMMGTPLEEIGISVLASANGKSAPEAATLRIPETETAALAAVAAAEATDTTAEPRAVVIASSDSESCPGRRCFVRGGNDGTAWWRLSLAG